MVSGTILSLKRLRHRAIDADHFAWLDLQLPFNEWFLTPFFSPSGMSRAGERNRISNLLII